MEALLEPLYCARLHVRGMLQRVSRKTDPVPLDDTVYRHTLHTLEILAACVVRASIHSC